MALTTLQKRAAAIAVACPACPAVVGEECRPGGAYDGVHEKRRTAAERAAVLALGAARAQAATDCPKCFADHATVQPGFSCTVHGHSFVYVETQDGEDRDECPEPRCPQGIWTS